MIFTKSKFVEAVSDGSPLISLYNIRLIETLEFLFAEYNLLQSSFGAKVKTDACEEKKKDFLKMAFKAVNGKHKVILFDEVILRDIFDNYTPNIVSVSTELSSEESQAIEHRKKKVLKLTRKNV